jgi:hypothetical protein
MSDPDFRRLRAYSRTFEKVFWATSFTGKTLDSSTASVKLLTNAMGMCLIVQKGLVPPLCSGNFEDRLNARLLGRKMAACH